MKIPKNGTKLFRSRFKAARLKGRHEGKLEASNEYQKSLRKLAEETNTMIVQMEGAHEAHIKMLTKQEKIFAEACEDLKKEREQVRQALRNIDKYEAKGIKQVQNVETLLNDEKTNKLIKVDLARC